MCDNLLLQIHNSDNVAVALADISAGERCHGVTAINRIPCGHKLCLTGIRKGGAVIKYGAPIGFALCDISPGEWVHSHNLGTALGGVTEYTYDPGLHIHAARKPGSFMGYQRADGRVGIRNEVWVIPTVGCVNGIAEAIARKAREGKVNGESGVYAFPHPYGCSQLGEDHANTQKALCGLIKHPNAGGVLVLGLGCENNGIEGIRQMLGPYDPDRVKFLVCQDEDDEIEAGLTYVESLLQKAACDRRVKVPVSKLTVGLKCGGSDGFSGITANPLVGAFADRLIAEGGTVILSEVPEMFGAETFLMSRCETPELFGKLTGLINGFKNYFLSHNQAVYENPSPGNKAGGITTLEEKSLGCIQKGGTANVMDVLAYGEQVKIPGLNLLEAPGNDLVASTAEVISGAQLVLFTTGRGTPFGSPAPTVKITSNTALYNKKRNWSDFDAGVLLAGASLTGEAGRLYEYIKALASGEIQTMSEKNGFREIAIFKNGVTL